MLTGSTAPTMRAMQLTFGAVGPTDLEALATWFPRQHWPFHGRERVDDAWVRERAAAGYFWGAEVRSFLAFDSERAPLALLRVFDFGDVSPLVDLRVADAARGRGVGSATLGWVTSHLFESESELVRLGGYTRHDNLAMRRAFEKCGYAQEAYHRRSWPMADGTLADSVGYAALRPEAPSAHSGPAPGHSETPATARPCYQGSCLCRSVRYELVGELGDFGYCHCTSCQKASGSAHGANAPVARADFVLLAGSGTLRHFQSSPGKYRVFCANCGSPLYAYLAATPEILRVRLGTLDTPFTRAPKAHTWVSEGARWAPIDGSIPQFPEWAPREVLTQAGSKQP
ncbi:MAG TPA: GNAT family N-acetyltransferase [Polyangiaceae bacterium]